MDDRGLEALASIVVLLFVFAVILCPVIALWVHVILQNIKRKRIRERVLQTQANLAGNHRWFPVRYASQPRFDSYFKILPWEAAGILVIVTGSVVFFGETLSGTPLTMQFAARNSRINWLGKCPWPNGAVSWLNFDTGTSKHYFSSETGLFIFGSHGSTKAIYDEAAQTFATFPGP